MKRILGSLFAILAIAMFVMACGDDKDSLKCAEGEVTASLDGEKACYKTCATTEDCPNKDTQNCRSTNDGDVRICVDKKPDETNDNNNNNNNNTPETPTISDENTALCEDYCELSMGCIYEWCGSENINPGLIQTCLFGSAERPEDKGCIGDLTGTSEDAAKIEAEAAEIRRAVYNDDGTKVTCEDQAYLSCAYANIFKAQGAPFNCGCEDSEDLGNECTKAEDCDSGTLPGACIPEKTTDGTETGFEGGYCIAQACDLEVALADRIPGSANPNSSGCGVGNYCVMEQVQGGVAGACFQGCKETEDCRPGYSCSAGASIVELNEDGSIKSEKMAKICNPASCEADTDCGTGENQGRCNTDTKACEFPCKDDKATEFCESGGGECTGDDDKKFCVLP